MVGTTVAAADAAGFDDGDVVVAAGDAIVAAGVSQEKLKPQLMSASRCSASR